MREFTPLDIKIFKKLAPEAGNMISPEGHQFMFILRPISHRFAQSSEDFRNRLDRLSKEELEYLVDLAFAGKEDVRSLEEEDRDVFFDMVASKISKERSEELKNQLGILR